MKKIVKNMLIMFNALVVANVILWKCILPSSEGFFTTKYGGTEHAPEETDKNFKYMCKNIMKICDEYGYEINDVSSFYDDDSEYIYPLLSKSMEIKIKENEYIVISLGSGCNYDIGKNGREGFDLDYEISDSKKRCMINIDLCEEMINELSCRSIRKRFLKDFINAPESKYPKTKYGSEKVKKYYTYDFWGNTDLYYVVKPSMIDKSEDEKILSYTSYLKDVW